MGLIKLGYDDTGFLKEIELIPLTAAVILEGRDVFKMRARELAKWMKEEDPEAKTFDGDMLVSRKKGLAIGISPSAKPTESVALFSEGIWDKHFNIERPK